ncbi:MAG: hypothetical protein K0S65_1603 [Labilithrix sp.]|nr:hypothetical protein [Labilithrix sp.]
MIDLRHVAFLLAVSMASFACTSSSGGGDGSRSADEGAGTGSPTGNGASTGDGTKTPGTDDDATTGSPYEAPAGEPCVEPGAYTWAVEAVPSDGQKSTCALGNMVIGTYEELQPPIDEGAKDLEQKQCTGTYVPPNTCTSTGTRCNWKLIEHFVSAANQAQNLPAQNVDRVLNNTVFSKTKFEVAGKETFSNLDGSNVRTCTWHASATKQ